MSQAQLRLFSRGVVLIEDRQGETTRRYTHRVYVDPREAFKAARRLAAFLDPDRRGLRCAVEAATAADGTVVS